MSCRTISLSTLPAVVGFCSASFSAPLQQDSRTVLAFWCLYIPLRKARYVQTLPDSECQLRLSCLLSPLWLRG